MAVPTRPSAGAVTEAAWGQVVHDTAVVNDIQTGQASCVHSANAVSGAVTVTFARPFASPPRVTLTPNNFNYAAGFNGAAPSATGFVVQTNRITQVAATGTVLVDWIAIGPRT